MPIPIAPMFTRLPQRKVVDLFDPVTLTCVAVGEPTPVIRWFKDDVQIAMEFDNRLVIDEVQLDDRGNYTCTATNPVGMIKSPPALVNVASK